MERISRMWRSGISLLLALCMVVGMCPVVAFAEETEETKTLNYVSLGDSMTNGYGLPGYEQDTGVYGYGYDSYANLFAQWLKEEKQVDEVHHAQLAMSGMRVEDLHWMLELDYNNPAAIDVTDQDWNKELWFNTFTNGDYTTWNEMCDDYRMATAAAQILLHNGDLHRLAKELEETKAVSGREYTVEQVQNDPYQRYIRSGEAEIVAKEYQDRVAEADVITLAIGNGNFGVFMFNDILGAIGFGGKGHADEYLLERAINELSPAMQKSIQELVDKLYAVMINVLGEKMGSFSEEQLNDLLDIFVYTGVSVVLNYAGTLEAILRLNPDAEIVVLGLMNTFAIQDSSQTEEVTLGDLLGAVYSVLNAYFAALPATLGEMGNELMANAEIYYADPGIVECNVANYGNDFYVTKQEVDGKTEYKVVTSYKVTDQGIRLLDKDQAAGVKGERVYSNPTVPITDSVIRDRFVREVVGDNFGGMIWGLLKDVEFAGMNICDLDKAEIFAYDDLSYVEKAAFAAQDAQKAISIAIYLAFEQAILAAKNGAPVTVSGIMGLGALDASLFAGVMEEFNKNIGTNSANVNYVKAAAQVVSAGSGGQLTPEQVIGLMQGGDAAIYATVAAQSGGLLNAEEVQTLYEAEDKDAAAYAVVAGKSGGLLTAEQVGALYQGGDAAIYATVAGMSNGLLTAEQVETLYLGGDAAIYATVAAMSDGMLTAEQVETLYLGGDAAVYAFVAAAVGMDAATVEQLYLNNANEQIVESVNALKTAVAGVDQLKTAVAGVDQLKTAVAGVDQIKANLETIIGGVDALKNAVSSGNMLCMLLAIPETLGSAVATDSKLEGLMGLFSRCIIGDGVGSHPSSAGYVTLFNNVKNAYENGHTVQDETAENLKELPGGEALYDVYVYLAANSYLTGEQILDVVNFLADRLTDLELTDAELFDVVKYAYEVLFYNEDLTDEDRVAIIVNVYQIVKSYGYLDEYEKELKVAEEIVALPELDHITDEQVFDIVDCIYVALSDGDVSEDEIRAIAKFIYGTVFANGAVRPFALEEEQTATLTAAEKVAIIEAIYKVLEKNGYLNPEEIPELNILKNLYKDLTAGEEPLLTDEKIFEIFDLVFNTVIDSEELNEEQVKVLIQQVIDSVLDDEKIPAENKVLILETVYRALEEGGMIDADEIPAEMYMIQDLYMELKASGLLTDEQVVEIIKEMYPILLSGEELTDERKQEILDTVCDIVFNREDLTALDKLEIIYIILVVLEENGYIEWPETPEPDWPEVPDFEWPESPDIEFPELPDIDCPTLPEKPDIPDIEWPTEPEKPEEPTEPEQPTEPEKPVEPEDKDEVIRISGKDRTATAREIADELKLVNGIEAFETIIYANGDVFADALTGTYFANSVNAPMLLYRPGETGKNLEYIKANLAKDGVVYILGGTAAMPESVEEELVAAGIEVERLTGKTRFETNLEILTESGFDGGKTVLVVTGWNSADCLAASALGMPILMVDNSTGKLLASQVKYLESLAAKNDFVIIGGEAAVGEELAEELAGYDVDGKVERLKGRTRFETSTVLAETYFNADQIVLAYGWEFADALCGGTLAYSLDAPIILADADKAEVVAEYTSEADVASGYVLGGTARLTDATVRTAFNMEKDDVITVK